MTIIKIIITLFLLLYIYIKLSLILTEDKTKKSVKNYTDNMSVNGEIDETIKQGCTGDCWILAVLIALSSTEKGRRIIKEAIKINKNIVSVYFKGLGQTFDVTKEEITKYDTDNILTDDLSNGDNDALVIEIATAKLRIDLANKDIKLPNSHIYYNNGEKFDYSDALFKGFTDAMFFYLTGKMADMHIVRNNTLDLLIKAFEKKNDNNIAMTFSVGIGTHTATCLDNSCFKFSTDIGHSFAVTDFTENSITIVNPWDSSKKYTMSWYEFSKLKITDITILQL